MSWEHWIISNGGSIKVRDYDSALINIVKEFNLNSKDRFHELVDQRHFLILWWLEKRKNFKEIRSFDSMGNLLSMNHSSISHYKKTRKKSFNYDANIQPLKSKLIEYDI